MIFLSYLSTLLRQDKEDKKVMSRGKRCLRLSFLLPQVASPVSAKMQEGGKEFRNHHGGNGTEGGEGDLNGDHH